MTHEGYELEAEPQHLADVLFQRLGHPDLGSHIRPYNGRMIALRDYFDQPDTASSARYYYEIATSGDESHPDYQEAMLVLKAYCDQIASTISAETT